MPLKLYAEFPAFNPIASSPGFFRWLDTSIVGSESRNPTADGAFVTGIHVVIEANDGPSRYTSPECQHFPLY
jgi:hypothetical protein